MNELKFFELVSLTLDDIVPNEDTHRYSLHPDFDGLKESIFIRGLESPLVVTLNPDSAGKYSIYSDGNSRLEALKELYTETGDARFFTVDCVLHPWTGRLDCVLRDLAAISTQGDKTHLDNSLEIYKAKELYERELGKSVSLRELSKYFDEQGILIGKDRISYSLKTIDIIFPAFPTLLEKGMNSQECRYLIGACQNVKEAWGKLVGDTLMISDQDLYEIFNSVAEYFDGVDLYRRDEFIARFSVALSKTINLSGVTPSVWVNVINDPSLIFYIQKYVPEVDDMVFPDFSDEHAACERGDKGAIVTSDNDCGSVQGRGAVETITCREADTAEANAYLEYHDNTPLVTDDNSGEELHSVDNNVYEFELLRLKSKVFDEVSRLANNRKPNQKLVKKNSTSISLVGYELVDIPSLMNDPFFKFAAAFTGFGVSVNGSEIISLLIGSHKEEPLLSDEEFNIFLSIINGARKLKLLQRQSRNVFKEVANV